MLDTTTVSLVDSILGQVLQARRGMFSQQRRVQNVLDWHAKCRIDREYTVVKQLLNC